MPTIEATISACILARNEEHQIEAALQSLLGWTDQIIVIDNESEDRTAEIARRYTDCVLTAPRAANFDAARNQAIDVATGGWIFYLDADERVPPRLGQALRQLVRERGNDFEALLIPFKHYFCGTWMQHSGWWPGYTRPQLLKKGCFRYNERLHTGATVQGRSVCFPADDPDLAIVHDSFRDLSQYLDKLNRYTTGEAESLYADGASHSWQSLLAHLVQDWQIYYDREQGVLDGMPGVLLAFLSGVYRFAARAKLWDLRRQRGEITAPEGVPASVEEMLEFMLKVLHEGTKPWLNKGHDPDPNQEHARWAEIYGRVELGQTPDHYQAFTATPFLAQYLEKVRTLCPPGGRVLETGIGFGYGAIWLSQRGLRAEGIDYSAALVQRATAANQILGGAATFRFGDFFDLPRHVGGDYDVIFHQGVLEHFSDEEIRTILRPQVARARHVVFSVPSVHYPFEREFGNERLLSLEEWRGLLAEFEIEALTYYGDPKLGAREHILGVLRGSAVGTTPVVSASSGNAPALNGATSGSGAPFEASPAGTRLPLLWYAPLLGSSGYADDARNLALGLIEAGEPVQLAPERWGDDDAGLEPVVRSLIEARTVPLETPAELCVVQTLLTLQQPVPSARFNIARTMFETDRLPPGAAERLNAMDRIWVPSEFNRDTFTRAGVDPAKIAVVPGAIDPEPFAAAVTPYELPGNEAFRFLSVFDWTLHKGWDILLEAFAGEFGDEPGVGLILKVWSGLGYPLEELRAQADGLLQAKLGRPLAEFPHIHLWWETLPLAALPALYRGVDAFVLPTRGEGWCRPLMEAMAAGLPTIATAWSGLTAFHNATVGYPLQYQLVPVPPAGAREVPYYAGHYWAEPSVADLRRRLRQLVRDPEAARAKGREGQQAVAERYSRSAVASLLKGEIEECHRQANGKTSSRVAVATRQPTAPRDDRAPRRPNANPVPHDPPPPVDLREPMGRPLRVQWEGDQSIRSSLALVNRELCLGLLAAGDVELSLREEAGRWHDLTEAHDPRFAALFACRAAPLSGPPDITIRHHFPPNWQRPESGKLVIIQPWEYGHLPRDWVAGALQEADEVWAYSRFVRDIYVRSGVPAEKVRVVPLGFNPHVFVPEGPRAALATQKSVRFLFVGGALERKGADLLLKAYRRAFTREDDVCLVVKDMGTQSFYYRQTLAEAFFQVQRDPAAPEILYTDEDLSEGDLAALYRACTCVVLPYRGEGFALTPLEGMACGLPAIVTSGGPTDDYLDDAMALRVPHHRRPSGGWSIGPFECTGDPWLLEPDREALVDALRWVRDHPEATRARGEAARSQARAGWTWDLAVGKARERIHALVAPPAQQSAVTAQLWAEPRRDSGHRPVRLSLCMIARDEEPRIEKCLKSIEAYVDEMIVVDTGSTDRTREIAAACGARVFECPWVDSFAAARNASLAPARGEWIFWMDADDVISPECGEGLRRLIDARPGKDAAYQVQVHIPPGPGEYSPSIVDHVKLFPNRADLRFEHRIHEQILPAIRRAGLEVCFSDLYVTHQHYDRSEAGQRNKRQRDFRLLALDLADLPDHPFVLFNLGMTYLYATKEYEVAAHYLRRSLDRSHWSDSIVRKAYAMLATARICQGEWEAALAVNEEGRSYYPDDTELLFQAGQIYQNVGRFEEARRALEQLVGGQEGPHYRSVDVGLRTYRGQYELALLYRRMGNAPACERMLQEITATQTDYLPAQIDLVETLYSLGRPDEAQRLLAQIPRVPGIDEELQRLQQRLHGIAAARDEERAPSFGQRRRSG